MRVIFLDVDGVLNTKGVIYKADRSKPRYETHLDPERIALLNKIVEQTGAVCVLSSSWRVLVKPQEFEEIMIHRGFSGKIIDRTGACGSRGAEIRDWLLEHPEVERFVVLDDEASDMELVKEQLVQTSWETGLTEAHVQEAIKHLQRKEGP